VRLARRVIQATHVLADVKGADIVIVDDDSVAVKPETLVRELRAITCTAEARLIALTTKDRRRHRTLVAAGFEAVVTKPLDARRFAQELALAMPAASEG
jgi:AmiR/NasT family two-component response regulator